MAYTIIDRTLNGKRSSGNRQKFVRRVKRTIRKQVNEQIANGSVKDLVEGKGKKINIPKKDLSQPTFRSGNGGKRDFVLPGNKKFTQGDRIPRPEGGAGGGGKGASKDGEGEDSYQFTLSQEEFLDMFFEDCELPDLKDTTIVKTDKFESKRAGYSTDGPAAMLNIPRTMRQSKGRRIGLLRKNKKKQLIELEAQELELIGLLYDAQQAEDEAEIERLNATLEEVKHKIQGLRRKLRAVPFIDDNDLRYNRWVKHPIPTTQAVMLNLMDVSASMGEWEKEMAKRFFMLLYLFLTRNYERVDVVWIRHHTRATEVDEEEFFKGRETGGTLVSTGLQLMDEIIKSRYPVDEWNIYACQASDGDNWQEDTHAAIDILKKKILTIARYYAYIEVDKSKRTSDLWPRYEAVAKQYEHFQMRKVGDVNEIYPVFKELFKKK